MNSLRQVIESVSLDTADSDRLALTVPCDVYEALDDQAFGWLADQALATDDPSTAAKYWLVLSSIGYYSDGFSLDFIERAQAIIVDPSAPADARINCAVGALRWNVLYRPEVVYQKMADLCTFVLTDRGAVGKDRVASGDARAMRSLLAKRARVFEDLRNGRLLILEEVVARIANVETDTGRRLVSLGFHLEDSESLRSLIVLGFQWGGQSCKPAADGSEVTELMIRARNAVRFALIRIHWRPLRDGRIVNDLTFYSDPSTAVVDRS